MQPHTYALAPKPASLEELIQKAKSFVAAAKAPATLKAYRNDWRDFESWCRSHQLPSLPSTPETVALYIADRASTLASGTITRRLTSITKAHQAVGFTDSPATTRHFIVGETLKGVRRTIGTAQHGKDPLLSADIRRIVAAGARTCLAFETQLWCWPDSRAASGDRSLQVSIYVISSSQPTASLHCPQVEDRPGRRRKGSGSPLRSQS
jgi:hypothetical protein